MIDKAESLELYYQMVMIRRVEESAAQLYQEGKIGGFLHLYIGQEAVSTGLISARKPEDRVITAYRDHGVAINCGIEAKYVLAELLGKSTGTSKGKGGSMHLADVKKNFWGGHAIVGAHLPIAAGLALGDSYQKNKSVTICMFGEGATNIGYFHEALNLSKVWNLPVVWVCENNQYGMGTSVGRASAVSEIGRKADGYDIPHECVDGMDILKVRQSAEKAIEHARSGGGPYFLEIETYRFRGHSMGDPERYRDPQEVKEWLGNDPIGIFRESQISQQLISESEFAQIDEKVEIELRDAIQFAENSPNPDPDALFENIYVGD